MNWMLILKYILAGCAVLSFCMNILIITYLSLRRKTRKEEIIMTILNSRRFEDRLCNLKTSIARSISNINVTLSPTKIELIKKEIIDEIRHLQYLDAKEITQSTPMPPTHGITSPSVDVVKKLYYATAVDGDSKTFCSVSDTPEHGVTVFLLTERQSGVCEFEVYEGAHSLVLSEREYLTGACSIDKTGNTKITTVQKGVTERTIEGKWIVKEQAKVKIE